MRLSEQERAEALRLYSDPDWSAADIARKFGTTRNAIIGMAYRERVPPEQRKRSPKMAAEREAAQARRAELGVKRNRARLLRTTPEFRSLSRNDQIATLHREGLSMQEIGALYGVCKQRISQIVAAVKGRKR